MDRWQGTDILFQKSLFKCVRGSCSLFCRVCGAVKWKRTLESHVHSRALESGLQPLGLGSFWKGCSVDPSGWDTHYQQAQETRFSEPECPLQSHIPTTSYCLPAINGKENHPMATALYGANKTSNLGPLSTWPLYNPCLSQTPSLTVLIPLPRGHSSVMERLARGGPGRRGQLCPLGCPSSDLPPASLAGWGLQMYSRQQEVTLKTFASS